MPLRNADFAAEKRRVRRDCWPARGRRSAGRARRNGPRYRNRTIRRQEQRQVAATDFRRRCMFPRPCRRSRLVVLGRSPMRCFALLAQAAAPRRAQSRYFAGKAQLLDPLLAVGNCKPKLRGPTARRPSHRLSLYWTLRQTSQEARRPPLVQFPRH